MIRLVLLLSLFALPAAAADTLLTLTPRPGATLRVVVDKPAAPVGSVILLAGGPGILDIDERGRIDKLGGNHLVRTRGDYAKAGWAAYVPDIASDLKGTNMYRLTTDHAKDLALVVQAARQNGGPVAIVGTSRGAVSAANYFTKETGVPVDALVISSGVLMVSQGGSASTAGDLSRVRVPVMLLRHDKDSCRSTPPADADRFKALLTAAPKVEIITLSGGGPQSAGADACGASHYHGFMGVDGEAVAVTLKWLAANTKR